MAGGTRAGGHPVRIVISYRREDTSGHAGHLYSNLRERFDVFMDIDNIPPGSDFVHVIQDAIDKADIMIVLIGDEWLSAADAKGRPRIRKPNDFVRLELEAALASDISILPVLVKDARMPSAEELPPSLRALARRNAMEISDRRWDSDVRELVTVLEAVARERGAPLPPAEAPRAEPRAEPVEPAPSVVGAALSGSSPVTAPTEAAAPRGPSPAPTWTSARRRGLLAGGFLALAALVIGVILLTGDDGGSNGGSRVIQGETDVPGSQLWTDTGLRVEPGYTVTVRATGTIRPAVGLLDVASGPEGLVRLEGYPDTREFDSNVVRGAFHASLIGRIGEAGVPFAVGAEKTFTADRGGVLYLGVNDTGVDNNNGQFQVSVTIRT